MRGRFFQGDGRERTERGWDTSVSRSKPWTTFFGNCPLYSSKYVRPLLFRGSTVSTWHPAGMCRPRRACGDSVIDATARNTSGGAPATASLPPKAVASPSTPRASTRLHSSGQSSTFFLELPAGDPAAMGSRVQKIMLQPIVRQRASSFVWLHGPCLYCGGCLAQRWPVRCVARVGFGVLFSFRSSRHTDCSHALPFLSRALLRPARRCHVCCLAIYWYLCAGPL